MLAPRHGAPARWWPGSSRRLRPRGALQPRRGAGRHARDHRTGRSARNHARERHAPRPAGHRRPGQARPDRLLAMFKSVIAALGQRELLGQGQRPQSSTTPPMLQNQPSPQAIPLCTSATQTGCAIAFCSFSSQPPANSVFGRPGQGTSLDPCLLTAPQIQAGLKEPVHTPWVTYPGLYSATCEHGGGAMWLQVTSLTGTSHTRPVVTEDILPGTLDTGPAWATTATRQPRPRQPAPRRRRPRSRVAVQPLTRS